MGRQRRRRRHKQLLGDLQELKRYWKLKEEALDRTLWRTHSGRHYIPVVRKTVESTNHNPAKYLLKSVCSSSKNDEYIFTNLYNGEVYEKTVESFQLTFIFGQF
jgi:hypothetical protein